METGLIKYDEMVRAITEAHAIDEVKSIRDKAMALERYAAQAMNTDAERKACEIRLRAEKKAGRMIGEQQKTGELATKGQDKSNVDQHDIKTLSDIGISRDQSSKWQKLARIDDDQFEAALSDPNERPTTSGILRKANGDSESKIHPDAVWVWGRLRDFERMAIHENGASMIAGEMTETMQADVARIAPLLIAWSQNLLEEVNK